jgi:hypothetical protein
MKALSLTQPWGSLVVGGYKHFETRGWHTRYRGPLVIHASIAFPRWAIEACSEAYFGKALNEMGYRYPSQLPHGMLLGVVELHDCVQVEQIRDKLTPQERSFGNYEDGRYAWHFLSPRRLPEPVFVRGHLGLWEVDDQTVSHVLERAS